MEQQPEATPTRPRSALTIRVSTCPASVNSADPTSASVPSLRFPKPQGSRQLANWVSSSSPDIMAPSSVSEDSLAPLRESFHIVNTEDGEGTESLASSVEFCRRPDSVLSFEDADRSDEDESDLDQDDGHISRAMSIQYAEDTLRSPSAQVDAAHGYEPSTDSTTPLVRSVAIEFNESDGPVYLEKISVKHTIQHFGEEETAIIAKNLDIRDPPHRLVAAVRQTMSHHFLSIREPLRILYIGSPAARKDILYKIGSALTASAAGNQGENIHPTDSEGGVYNIVPISAFGTSDVPDIELIETSGYQIKTEHCTSAQEILYKGQDFPSDTVYSITVDHERTYSSAFSPSGSIIQPAWDLPHVAIFYCTETDDGKDEETRDVAWKFMARHGVPSIFISHSQCLDRPLPGDWYDFVDQAAAHLCLESRDPERPMLPKRLPIDLNSFLNIDARQMNRNLAYLTGFQESLPSVQKSKNVKSEAPLSAEPASYLQRAKGTYERAFEQSVYKWHLLSALSLLFTVAMIQVLTSVILSGGSPPVSSTVNQVATHVTSSASAGTVSTATATVTINLTSTKTIQLGIAEPTTHGIPSNLPFGGFLSDKSQAAAESPVPKGVCTAEIYSHHEILLKVPSGTKTSWLAKGAIDIDVHRGTDNIKTRLSTIDEGILVEIPEKDAHGVLNVSVVTSRKPKINETFDVDFGRPIAMEIFEAGKRFVHDVSNMFYETTDDLAKVFDNNYAAAVSSATDNLQGARKLVNDYSEDAATAIKNVLNAKPVLDFVEHAQQGLAKKLARLENLHEDLEISFQQAQVVSKLWWLRMQGRMDEHADYQRKATRFLKKKHDEAVKARKAQSRNSKTGESSWATWVGIH